MDRLSCFVMFSAMIFILKINLSLEHGRMIDPPGRGSMWRFGFDVAPNYNDMSNYCGGFKHQWDRNNGKCGVCGDPYDQEPKEHEPGGQFATGIIGKTYYEGQTINITIDITANHYGYFEFRLCQNDEPMRKVTQECFDRNLLQVYNNNEEVISPQNAKSLIKELNKFKYFVPIKNKSAKFYVHAQLPQDITCKQCILQWHYHAGNNFGKSAYGRFSCLGALKKQEEFFNCADIEIVKKSDESSEEIIEVYNITNASMPNCFKNNLRTNYLSLSISEFLFYLFLKIIFIFS